MGVTRATRIAVGLIGAQNNFGGVLTTFDGVGAISQNPSTVYLIHYLNSN